MTSFIFIQPHLRFGGAERQTVNIANQLALEGHHVSLILHSAQHGLIDQVGPQVAVYDLGLESHLATIDVARRMHSVLRKLPPSFVIVKLWSSILACALVDRLPSVRHHTFNYCEDLDPSDHARYIRFGKIKQTLIRNIFRARPHLSANTHTVAESMVSTYGLTVRPTVIPSTVDPTKVMQLAAEDPRQLGSLPNILTVGSLIPRKGLDLIQKALEDLDQPLNWHLVGEGPLRAELESYRDPSAKLHIHVHPGTSNPYGFMKAADFLLHGARSEAWGIVLLEAMAVGTPVLAARSIGPVEMQTRLGHQPNILRIYDPASARDLKENLYDFLALPKIPQDQAHAYIDKFSIQTAVSLWEARAVELMEKTRG